MSDRDIYREENSKDWIIQNDLYFNLNMVMRTEKDINIIRNDNAILTPDKHIQTKYLLEQSEIYRSCCKLILLNIIKHPDRGCVCRGMWS